MTEKTERRGRPAEQPFVQSEKWTREFYEVPSKPELGMKTVFHYDKNKNVDKCKYNYHLVNNIERFSSDFVLT